MTKRGVVTEAIGTVTDTAIAGGIQFLESLSPFHK
jgi:hypothetical protein